MNIAWWHRFSAPTGRRYHRDARHDPPRLPQPGPASWREAQRPLTAAVRLGRSALDASEGGGKRRGNFLSIGTTDVQLEKF
jgi:hypothetical protein